MRFGGTARWLAVHFASLFKLNSTAISRLCEISTICAACVKTASSHTSVDVLCYSHQQHHLLFNQAVQNCHTFPISLCAHCGSSTLYSRNNQNTDRQLRDGKRRILHNGAQPLLLQFRLSIKGFCQSPLPF